MTRAGVIRLFAAAQSNWTNTRWDDLSVEFWLQALDDIDDGAALRALVAHANDIDNGKFRPTTADIRRHAERESAEHHRAAIAEIEAGPGVRCPWPLGCTCTHVHCVNGWVETPDGRAARCPDCDVARPKPIAAPPERTGGLVRWSAAS